MYKVKSVFLVIVLLSFILEVERLAAATFSAHEEVTLAEQIYANKCAQCHDKPIANAPHRIVFSMLGAKNIYKAMSTGVMRIQASGLSEDQLKLVAEHLGENRLADENSTPVTQCDANTSHSSGNDSDVSSHGKIDSWGFALTNTRWNEESLTRDEIGRLKLKWVFAYPESTRARSQPTVTNNTVYVGSQTGSVYALDLDSGCVKWTYQARAEVRTAIIISDSWDGQGKDLIFGDFDGNAYSLSAKDGQENWLVTLPDHQQVTITGTPQVYNGVVYVPLSSREWATAADPAYPCCTFRGGVVALNQQDGSRKWVSYTLDKAKATGEKNSHGSSMMSPSGAPVWHTPAIDTKRNQLYIGTGENYSSPATETSDAIIAMDLDSGDIAWVYQSTKGDAWNMACFIGGGANCPEENGPDHDFGAPPILFTLSDKRDVVLAGQKSGEVMAINPDNGKLLWKNKISLGGIIGGVHWGMAAANDTLFVPITDTSYGEGSNHKRKPGLFSINAGTGELNWYSQTNDRCPPDVRLGCDPGLSAAITGTENAIFAGGLDGYLYAFDTKTGDVIWEFATDKEFDSLSGDIARGGSIDADGPVVIDGHVLINSGYSFGGRMPGNALLVFSVDGK